VEVIYCCYGGTHTSVTVAAIHIGLLPTKSRPSPTEILALPYFDRGPRQPGHAFKLGVDEYGNNVYVAGLGPNRHVTAGALSLVLSQSQVSEDELCIVDALQCINMWVRLGGLLSRRLGMVRLGRPLCVYGILLRYDCFVHLAEQVKARVAA